jgi:hypothetical protein
LPDSLVQQTKEWAEKDEISVNQFVATAVAEKLAALSTVKLLETRAKRASRAKFEAALSQVPDVEPASQDRLPAKQKNRLRLPSHRKAVRGGNDQYQ